MSEYGGWQSRVLTYFYPINGADQQRGIGPLLGRYPGDVYDGDTDAQVGDHSSAVSTASLAEPYYRLAGQVTTDGTVPLDSLSVGFFSQVGVDVSTTPAAAAAALQAAGDQMLQAVIFHSDNLELERAVRRRHRIGEERQQPVLELRLIPVRHPRQDRHLR